MKEGGEDEVGGHSSVEGWLSSPASQLFPLYHVVSEPVSSSVGRTKTTIPLASPCRSAARGLKSECSGYQSPRLSFDVRGGHTKTSHRAVLIGGLNVGGPQAARPHLLPHSLNTQACFAHSPLLPQLQGPSACSAWLQATTITHPRITAMASSWAPCSHPANSSSTIASVFKIPLTQQFC